MRIAGILLDEFALGVRLDVVLVAVMHFRVLLGPARVHVFLLLFGRLFRPLRWRAVAFDRRKAASGGWYSLNFQTQSGA